jgi:DNA-binding XRE family transcriptional regulator
VGSACGSIPRRPTAHTAARPVAPVKLVCIEVASNQVGSPPVPTVSGSMVQNRKLRKPLGQTMVFELRCQRQADAANPSEWTQAGLAHMVGASVRSVKAWEAGDTVPRPFYRRRLARVLGVSVTKLGF